MPPRLSRRGLLSLLGTGLASTLVGGSGAVAQAGGSSRLRIGLVLPLRGGLSLDPNTQELAGESARRGAIMAEEDFGNSRTPTTEPELLISSAPDANAALRAATRLADSEEAVALVGGFGREQAVALAQVARQTRVPFLNIGYAGEELRADDSGLVFHIEASAAMYLRALVSAHLGEGGGGVFLIHGDDEEGRELRLLAREVAGAGGDLAGEAVVAATSDHPAAIEAVAGSGAGVVLMLLDWRQQLDFLGRYESEGLTSRITGFPFPVTQTHDFLASALSAAPGRGTTARVWLWEAVGDAAKELGGRFLARWGRPMDPPAWAAYLSVALLSSAAMPGVAAAQGLSDLGEVPVYKSSPARFRACDRQLLQSLYLIEPVAGAEASADLVRVLAELPAGEVVPDDRQGENPC